MYKPEISRASVRVLRKLLKLFFSLGNAFTQTAHTQGKCLTDERYKGTHRWIRSYPLKPSGNPSAITDSQKKILADQSHCSAWPPPHWTVEGGRPPYPLQPSRRGVVGTKRGIRLEYDAPNRWKHHIHGTPAISPEMQFAEQTVWTSGPKFF